MKILIVGSSMGLILREALQNAHSQSLGLPTELEMQCAPLDLCTGQRWDIAPQRDWITSNGWRSGVRATKRNKGKRK